MQPVAELGPAVCMAVLCVMGCIIRLFFDKDFSLQHWLMLPTAAFILLTPVGILLVLLSTDWKDKASSRRGHYGTYMVLLNIPIIYFPVLAYEIVEHRIHMEIINQSGEAFDTVLIRDDHHSFVMGRFDADTPVLRRYITPYTLYTNNTSWKNPVLELRRGAQTDVIKIRYLYHGERVFMLNQDLELITKFTTDDPATFHQ